MHTTMPATAAESTTSAPSPLRGIAAIRMAAMDIKLSHTVFALPFAVLGAFLARDPQTPWSRFGVQLLLILVCMVFGRTWAMLVNRIADQHIDASNPRTARRAFAAGKLSNTFGAAALGVCALGFVAGASGFWFHTQNPWPLILSLPVLAYLGGYSFTKRFTWLCHLYLGVALSISPVAAALAINPSSLSATPAIWWLMAMIAPWVAGFDIIYALQDVEIDRAAGLWSVPSRLGVTRAIWISRLLHIAAFASLAAGLRSEPRFGPLFGAAVALVGLLLITEHAVLARRGKAGLEMAFFTLNGIVSCVLGIAGCTDLFL
ncbi:MAG TPA: UbiA-like polyprenyltransferase [Phycisphaerales bacterium]|nr:UbiA-like polyprenyltransferase [Phycisphaerales bacterium]